MIYGECAAQLVSAPLLADAEPDPLVLPNSHFVKSLNEVTSVLQSLAELVHLSELLERNPGRILTEVAEEKKAWKNEKTTLKNI